MGANIIDRYDPSATPVTPAQTTTALRRVALRLFAPGTLTTTATQYATLNGAQYIYFGPTVTIDGITAWIGTVDSTSAPSINIIVDDGTTGGAHDVLTSDQALNNTANDPATYDGSLLGADLTISDGDVIEVDMTAGGSGDAEDLMVVIEGYYS